MTHRQGNKEDRSGYLSFSSCDDSSVNVRNLRKCSDKLKQNTTNEAKNKNEIDSDINDTDDNIIVQEQVGQNNQKRTESEDCHDNHHPY
jgi:hypothetical protein